MFKENSATEAIDNSTCKLYEIISYGFIQLCSLKDNIIGKISPEPLDDIYSTSNVDRKTGLLTLF